MPVIISKIHKGLAFQVQVKDCLNITNDNSNYILSGIKETAIVFYSPLGVRTEKTATIIQIPRGSGNHYIRYSTADDDDTPILFDIAGAWYYTGMVKHTNGNEFENAELELLFVS